MVYSRLYKVTDTQLIITLPPAFKNKQVRVTIDDKVMENNKIALMKLAAKDPLFLSDMREVNNDFDGIEHESI